MNKEFKLVKLMF